MTCSTWRQGVGPQTNLEGLALVRQSSNIGGSPHIRSLRVVNYSKYMYIYVCSCIYVYIYMCMYIKNMYGYEYIYMYVYIYI